ncbi:hypothetical protein KSP39_PZI008720 [Platanthera zijinensis]|uniref:Uncharacterized protein n=1 Tax=Platanthera zijinensis TaxID=2320716 RepID=A0AAP0BKI9_9ASPA
MDGGGSSPIQAQTGFGFPPALSGDEIQRPGLGFPPPLSGDDIQRPKPCLRRALDRSPCGAPPHSRRHSLRHSLRSRRRSTRIRLEAVDQLRLQSGIHPDCTSSPAPNISCSHLAPWPEQHKESILFQKTRSISTSEHEPQLPSPHDHNNPLNCGTFSYCHIFSTNPHLRAHQALLQCDKQLGCVPS